MTVEDEIHGSEEERRESRDRRDAERRLDERRRYGIGEILPERRGGLRRTQDQVEEEVVELERREVRRRDNVRRLGPRRSAEAVEET